MGYSPRGCKEWAMTEQTQSSKEIYVSLFGFGVFCVLFFSLCFCSIICSCRNLEATSILQNRELVK